MIKKNQTNQVLLMVCFKIGQKPVSFFSVKTFIFKLSLLIKHPNTHLDLNCQSVFKDLKSKLENLLDSRNMIADLLNKPQGKGTIKIDIKYQM